MKMGQLSGQTALITGASAPNGIGRAIAWRLAQEGASVVVSDVVGRDLLNELAEALPGDALALEMDVSNERSVTVGVAKAQAEVGRIDILVNNAATLTGSADFLTTTPSEWRSSFAVNLLGPVLTAQAVLPDMREAGSGRIINIGSTASLGAEAGFGAYTAMKQGLVGLTKTLAAEFGPDGIRCNCVCPGFIKTDMHEAANARLAAEQDVPVEKIRAARYASVALRDAGTPADVAEAVAFLAGPGGDYVTGINFPVAGGVPFGI